MNNPDLALPRMPELAGGLPTPETMNNENDMAMAEVPSPQLEKVSEYRPTTKEALREYEIRIKFLHRGCLVSVGCKDIAFENPMDAMEAINAYVANPWEEQKKWRKILD